MLGVDHDKIILLSTLFTTIPMLGKNCCCDVIVFYVGNKRCCIVLYCIVLHCIVLYCIVLYCIVLYCIVLYCIVLYCIVLYCIVLYSDEFHSIDRSTIMRNVAIWSVHDLSCLKAVCSSCRVLTTSPSILSKIIILILSQVPTIM